MSRALIERDHSLSADPMGPHRMRLSVPKDLVFFEGHYEGAPVMAAAVQFDLLFLPMIEKLWPDLGGFIGGRRIKFKRPIGPEDQLELELQRQRAQVQVLVRRGGEIATQGTLLFEEAP